VVNRLVASYHSNATIAVIISVRIIAYRRVICVQDYPKKKRWENYTWERRRMARGTDFRGPISIPESQTIPVHAVQKEHLSDKKITRGWNLAKWCSFSVFGVGAVLFWISLLAPYFRWHPAWAGFSPQLMWIGILLFCLVLLSDWVYWRVVRHERYFIGRVTPRIAKTIFCIGVMTIFV